MMASVFNTSVNMGILTTLVISFALIGDLFFLPALLIGLDRKKQNETDPKTGLA